MKHLKISSLLVAFLLLFQGVFAQQNTIDWNTPLPTDPKVIIGELENGMRYYIRKNNEPKERAEFYIVHNVGAMMEDDDQNGLAHFTEHMAFNGTENFPKKGVLEFLENIGVKFGHNVNAYTAHDETAYNLSNVPLTREGIIDSALLVLHDWSSYIAFEDEEIDAERGVIHEEWRTRRTADWRLMQKKFKALFYGSKYAERDVIGDINIIDNFEHSVIRRFYHDWYRPDLQAIIIVGDFDPQMMEAKVKERFSKIPTRENVQPRPSFEVPAHKEPIIDFFTDKELSRTTVEVYYKHPVVPADQKNLGYYRNLLIENLYYKMINARFNELTQKDNAPFVFAYNYYGNIVRTMAAYALVGIAKENESKTTLKGLLEENYRVLQHGFTQTELDRAKAELLRSIENNFKEKDKVKNQKLIREMMSHFTENEPMPGIEFEYMFSQSLFPSITLNDVNVKAKQWITDESMVFFISAPEKDAASLPSKDDVLKMYNEVKSSTLEAYVDNVSTEPLITDLPDKGKVEKETSNETFATTEWELSNGVKVIVKPTDFKEDEVMLSAYSPGGYSLVDDKDVPTAQMVSNTAIMSGISSFSRVDLEKMLAGKIVSVNPYIGENEEGFSGSCSPNDLETMLQMVHLYFTKPRFDETAFNAYISRIQAILQNASSNPQMIFRDSISYITSNRNYRERPFNLELIKEIDFSKMESIYKNRFADASDFTFIILGNVNSEELKPMVETYLGSLPSINRKETWKDNNIRFPKGENKYPFTFNMQVPKSSCFIAYNSNVDYNLENMLFTSAIEHVLGLRYTESIREKEGGTYGVSARINLSKTPENTANVNIFFDTDPEKATHLVGLVHEEFQKIINEGPTELDLNKAREYFLKTRQERLRENRFWANAIREYYQNNIDVLSGYEDMVKKLSTSSVQKAAKDFFTKTNMVEIVMSPEK
ncbi:MAG TPA: insulinase family protein [Tenuifilaceae bacterium]|nr:insulinase family protein [Tenuifilaceae bacterium]HPE18090.1 insulinase family protein [Tenuifilaceae bacterium]HPJ45460.1 insulinase family protein [Tenuifilaceae bacterium]HPQ34077.1 insulinase family protein [Tenuifilaceae bacterium]HRX68028.1 insulinase family protein [Tenuifilaceae bacterium]